MLKTHTLRRLQTGAIALAVLVGLASLAEARTFRMSGNWRQNRSIQLQIPIFGGINAVDGALVTATGTGAAATLTVPANQFTKGVNTVAFPLAKSTLVQITTQFSFSGPGAPGVFSSGPKTTRAANFAWCPGATGAAIGACTDTGAGGSQGTKNGRITYTAGANQFGGTMLMLIGGTGSLTTLLATLTGGTQSMVHNTIGGLGTATMATNEVGGVYENTSTVLLPGGQITTGGVCPGGPCGVAANGVITAPGVVVGTGASSINENTGFPWTTGAIFGITTTQTVDQDVFTETGSDTRTALGAGNISLVAGGLSTRQPTGNVFISLDRVTMTMTAQNLPAMSPPGVAALAAILIAGAGYAIRRRS